MPRARVDRATRQRQGAVGLALAVAILAAWLAIHVGAVFLVDWHVTSWWWGLPAAAAATWLSVGLFIVAHDAMHGSLAPGRPEVNRWTGRLALLLYAGISYDRLLPDHHRHHRRPGSAEDPDFHPERPDAFVPWLARFFAHYYGWRDLLTLAAGLALYGALAGPPLGPLLAFYAAPALLSALQLFYFGTYRPHRVDGRRFVDGHNARSDGFPWLLSLLACFHFGYHHEHHLSPATPWWRLPRLRATLRADKRAAQEEDLRC